MRRPAGIALLLTVLFLLTGLLPACVRVEPEIVGTPTPSASPTPLPEPFTAEITAAPAAVDQLGKRIETEDHYYRYYLSFGDLRVYEYNTGTFLDGICVNAYPQALEGRVNIVYYSEDGRVCGIGTIHTADGGTRLESGRNAVYAEIQTDINVQDRDFVLEVETPFAPAMEEPGETAVGNAGNG
ncbi:MAG: hypothetical protein PUE41_07615 [bacterium]|nr:hypothetical protein [bacterium]